MGSHCHLHRLQLLHLHQHLPQKLLQQLLTSLLKLPLLPHLSQKVHVTPSVCLCHQIIECVRLEIFLGLGLLHAIQLLSFSHLVTVCYVPTANVASFWLSLDKPCTKALHEKLHCICSLLSTGAQDSLMQLLTNPAQHQQQQHVVCCTGNAEAQAGEAGAGPSSSNTTQAAPAAAEDEGDNIDPEFLAALPPEIQAEVLEQQRRERRMRQRQRQQQEAAAAAAAQVSFMPSCNMLVM